MNVLIAPDKFRHALSAAEAADALAAGVRDAAPTARIDLAPLADGGEGTGELLAAACGAERRVATVSDALGRPTAAAWWWDTGRQRAIIELAGAAGLVQLAPAERDPTRTTTFGVGQLLREAVLAGAGRVDLCVGGSATCDGGAGCLQALGWRLRLADGWRGPADRAVTGGDLLRISAVEPPSFRPLSLRVLCDVRNPLVGSKGAAEVFASQKGATPTQVQELASGLVHWARLLRAAHGRDVSSMPHGGAAGGIAAGLAAALKAELVAGFDVVTESGGLSERVARADLCLTGEGRLDAQTREGKVVCGVARLAAGRGVPVVAIVGCATLAPGQSLGSIAAALGLHEVIPLGDRPADAGDPALARTGSDLRRAARGVVERALRGEFRPGRTSIEE